MNYETIKQLAKDTKGCRVTDLIALAPQNDPFYVGAPAQRTKAEWFAEIFHGFNITSRIHNRRVHYRLISQHTPFEMPNGKPYENTTACWEYLENASKYARYLDLVDSALIDDRRNPPPIVYTARGHYEPFIDADFAYDFGDVELPSMPSLPSYNLGDFETNQRYHIEIWCEKSTMNDVLEPLCRAYKCNLVTGIGEMSAVALHDLVAVRLNPEHPARVFYISDFDPGGQSMPVAASRKCEFYIDKLCYEGDVRFYPIVMTAEQIRHYKLPRTPIKETERRAARFEDRHGEGAVELDALEALYPGELRRIVKGEIERYYDKSLDERVLSEKSKLWSELDTLQESVYDKHAEDIKRVQDEYERISEEFEERISDLNSEIVAVWQAIKDELEENMPDIDDYPIPEALEAEEKPNALYDSKRSYLEQMASYKDFQGKEVVDVEVQL